MKANNPRFSETISLFISMMENAKKDYAWNYEEVNRLEKLTQDYLHSLELDGLTYKERARVATQLALIRKERIEHIGTTHFTLNTCPVLVFSDTFLQLPELV